MSSTATTASAAPPANIIGYKIFDRNFRCRGYQYRVGCTEILPDGETLELCKAGYHLCRDAINCLEYYDAGLEFKYARVKAVGKVIEAGNKCVTDKLLVEAEITRAEFLEMCTGTVTLTNGTQVSYRKGLKHSFDDKPSTTTDEGRTLMWHYNGFNMRDKGPCYITRLDSHLSAYWSQDGIARTMAQTKYIHATRRRIRIVIPGYVDLEFERTHLGWCVRSPHNWPLDTIPKDIAHRLSVAEVNGTAWEVITNLFEAIVEGKSLF